MEPELRQLRELLADMFNRKDFTTAIRRSHGFGVLGSRVLEDSKTDNEYWATALNEIGKRGVHRTNEFYDVLLECHPRRASDIAAIRQRCLERRTIGPDAEALPLVGPVEKTQRSVERISPTCLVDEPHTPETLQGSRRTGSIAAFSSTLQPSASQPEGGGSMMLLPGLAMVAMATALFYWSQLTITPEVTLLCVMEAGAFVAIASAGRRIDAALKWRVLGGEVSVCGSAFLVLSLLVTTTIVWPAQFIAERHRASEALAGRERQQGTAEEHPVTVNAAQQTASELASVSRCGAGGRMNRDVDRH